MAERVEEISVDPFEFEQLKPDIRAYCSKRFNLTLHSIREVRILRKSLDARKKDIVYRLRLAIYTGTEAPHLIGKLEFARPKEKRQVHIAGFGPAGIFAALKLLRLGIKPIIIERGKAVKDRRRDVASLSREGLINPESNYCFGEGGAGTFSDGKLYTRSHKRGKIQDILEILVLHGADASILYEAHPHIGTNKLPAIIEKLRETIIEHGGEVRFNACLEDIEIIDGNIRAIRINGKEENCEKLILATGHSARDIYELLYRRKIKIEAKPFAMGFRIEHPQSLINHIQYHNAKGMDLLPPASYSLVNQVKNKGVFSFCMCPGGIIAPAATAEGEVVVNGWSPSKRNGTFANSGWVTEIDASDWKDFSDEGPLAGLRFQQSIEQKASGMAGGAFKIPAQNLRDYLQGRKSEVLNASSYHRGMTSCDLNTLYSEEINFRLRQGLMESCRKMKGFEHEKAIVTAPESRTSAPIRIPRDETFQHPDIRGLYPCGEGAGYAGGIISAALDGERCAGLMEFKP